MKIEHVAIWSKDLEKHKQFFETYFNAQASDKYINEHKGFSSYFLTFSEGARLELMNMPCIPESKDNIYEQFTGLIHLAMSLGSKEKVDTLTKKLATDGFEVLDGPRTTGDGYYESVVLDPEGNRLELTE
ncbi:VOC family protein [Endozoicomonas arenosclerae]|uniref:VOC family protein n=1 Tax=Endozoicomonas arenosclerae TaxID=1633495 RepID=UPI0007827FF5|nr:VOC family protein [Endozoicomonas arenosclerae]